MNNDNDEDASINPLTHEVVIKQIGSSIDGRYESKIMESTTTNESTYKSKKRKAYTENEDFFENGDEFSTKEQRTDSLKQIEKDFERKSNECSGKSRVVIVIYLLLCILFIFKIR